MFTGARGAESVPLRIGASLLIGCSVMLHFKDECSYYQATTVAEPSGGATNG